MSLQTCQDNTSENTYKNVLIQSSCNAYDIYHVLFPSTYFLFTQCMVSIEFLPEKMLSPLIDIFSRAHSPEKTPIKSVIPSGKH